jgi:hypothetical protein
MNMPGFTADVSVHRPSSIYRAGYGVSASNALTTIIPQLSLCEFGCFSLQKLCHLGCAGISVYRPWDVPDCFIDCAEHLVQCVEDCNRPEPPTPFTPTPTLFGGGGLMPTSRNVAVLSGAPL